MPIHPGAFARIVAILNLDQAIAEVLDDGEWPTIGEHVNVLQPENVSIEGRETPTTVFVPKGEFKVSRIQDEDKLVFLEVIRESKTQSVSAYSHLESMLTGKKDVDVIIRSATLDKKMQLGVSVGPVTIGDYVFRGD